MNAQTALTEVAKTNRRNRAEWAAVINSNWRKSLDGIFTTGRDLQAAKNELSAKDYTAMLREDLDFSPKTANSLIRLVNHPDINPPAAADLPASWATLTELTRLSKADFSWAQKRGLITTKTSKRGARALSAALATPEGDIVESGTGMRPSPAEARKIAKETERLIVASDGRLYTGATEEETAEYRDRRQDVFDTADAIKLIISFDTPEAWWGGVETWWESDFSAAEARSACKWLEKLADLLETKQ